MFRLLARFFSKLLYPAPRAAADSHTEIPGGVPFHRSLWHNIEAVKGAMGASEDVKIHEMRLHDTDAAILFIDGMVNSEAISRTIIRPIVEAKMPEDVDSAALPDRIRREILQAGETDVIATVDAAVACCLSGDTVLFIDGLDKAIFIGTKGFEKRGITEPQTESVVRGPREGFTENLRTNTSLLRRRIRSRNLRIEHMKVGEQTQTGLCIAYIQDVVQPDVVEEVRKRIRQIDVDAILDSGYIEEYIEDSPFSAFPTVGFTEKPDVVAGRILEGRVGILVDGSPFALTAPMLFIESFQTAEDYYVRPFYASLTRFMRYIAYFITLYLPGLFVAMTTFHPELIPTTLLLSILNAREGTPFPAVVEALILIFSFEILREAGLRLPRHIGQAISIVGALIMGDAAVSAGLVGAPMVIIVAITAVSGFVVPELSDSSSLLRIIILIMGSVFGGLGIALSFWGILIHLASLESFGVPYFEGLTFSTDMKDSVVRAPLWSMVNRPKDLAGKNVVRGEYFVPPNPPEGDGEGDRDA